MKALILAGGSGTRLWPVSRIEYPKQFLKIGSDESLLQKAVFRLLEYFSCEDIFFLTNSQYFFILKEQLEEMQLDLEKNILFEPSQKNTAPAIAFGIKALIDRGISLDEPIFVSPSDQILEPQTLFGKYVKRALHLAEKDWIVTFGILPKQPETGYGYIEAGEPIDGGFKALQFVEKPDLETAKEYIAKGNFYWNSGMFAFSIQTMLDAFCRYFPELEKFVEGSLPFEKLTNISIDYAIMEKSKKTVVLGVDLFWSDVGSWDSVYDVLPKDSDGNAALGETIRIGTKNSLILGGKRLIATIGLDDMLIVETPDVVFIAKKNESQKVKDIVLKLKEENRSEIKEHLTTNRPWGSYTVLDLDHRYKIKKISVKPGHTLSLQKHFHRSEHWVIVKGTAKVTIGKEETFVHENESIYVPKGALHRVSNPGKIPLELIETQVGEYLGEDDIVRMKDDYGRS